MARASAITALPIDVQTWLDSALIENNFSDYQGLEGYLREKGFDISRSSLHRYGQKFESRLKAIKDSTKAAQMITEAAADEGENRSEAVIALVQSDMFDLIVSLQEIEGMDEKDKAKRIKVLSDVAHSMANLTRASVNLREYQAVVKTKAEKAANEVEQIAKKGGLSAEAAETIRRMVLGIVS